MRTRYPKLADQLYTEQLLKLASTSNPDPELDRQINGLVHSKVFALDEDNWITTDPENPNQKGQHVKIDENGIIRGGLGGNFNGLSLEEAFGDGSNEQEAPTLSSLMSDCDLPFKGQITDGIDLQKFKGELPDSKLQALLYGPDKFAQQWLTSPFNVTTQILDDKLARKFKQLDANYCAATGLTILHQQGICKLSQAKQDQIQRLIQQRHQFRIHYARYTKLRADEHVAKVTKELQQRLPNSSPEEIQNGGLTTSAETLRNNIQYGSLNIKPKVLNVILHKGFKCHNSYVDSWRKLIVLQGSLINYQPVLKRAWPKYDDELLVTSMYLGQIEQAIEIRLQCLLDAALDREYSYVFQRIAPDVRNPAYKAKSMSHTDIGTVMTIRLADERNSNPHYEVEIIAFDLYGNEYRPYQSNCQSCFVAFVQRLRGLNVEALPNYKKGKGETDVKELGPERLSHYVQSIWYNPKTKAAPDTIHLNYQQTSSTEFPRQLEGRLNKLIKPNQVYGLCWNWGNYEVQKGGTIGHIVAVLKDKDGHLILCDAQKGQLTTVSTYFTQVNQRQYQSKVWVDQKTVKAFRVDDCYVMSDYAALVLTEANTPVLTKAQMHTREEHLSKRKRS